MPPTLVSASIGLRPPGPQLSFASGIGGVGELDHARAPNSFNAAA